MARRGLSRHGKWRRGIAAVDITLFRDRDILAVSKVGKMSLAPHAGALTFGPQPKAQSCPVNGYTSKNLCLRSQVLSIALCDIGGCPTVGARA